MALTEKQITEMTSQIREESKAGRPEVAAQIRQALAEGEPFGEVVAPVVPVAPNPPPTGGPGSSKERWAEFALEASDLDEEIVEAATQKDLIMMLRANGIIPFPEEVEED